jgi:hypothetical protein
MRLSRRTTLVTGIAQRLYSFFLAGFIRFLEGYYIVLVTKRRQVASLGGHCVYKIEETAMLPIQSPNTRLESHPDEYKCVMSCRLVVLPNEYKRVFPAGAIFRTLL